MILIKNFVNIEFVKCKIANFAINLIWHIWILFANKICIEKLIEKIIDWTNNWCKKHIVCEKIKKEKNFANSFDVKNAIDV